MKYYLDNKKIIENIIQWANDKIGFKNYARWCLSFIEDSLENSNNIEIFGRDSARDGKIIYAWNVVRIDNYLNIEKLVAISGDHPKYLGWVPIERVMHKRVNYFDYKKFLNFKVV